MVDQQAPDSSLASVAKHTKDAKTPAGEVDSEQVGVPASISLTVDPAIDDPAIEDFRSPNRGSSGSSVLEQDSINEYGRTYHSYKQGTYLLPNDAEEQDRLDLQHATVSLLLDGKLAWAPIDNPANVLDLATGTGIWAIEFARENPNSNVIGSDLSLIQPSEVVSNCSFVREDAEYDEWSFNEKFDYIHLRLLFTCFDNVNTVMRKMYDHTRPGGWVEFQDHTPEICSEDGSTRDTAVEKYSNGVMKGLSAIGRDAARMKNCSRSLEAVGFVDVEEIILPYPVGDWPKSHKFKNVGRHLAENVSRGLEGTSLKILLAGGMSVEEVRETAAKVRAEFQSGKVHAYVPFYIICGRKPLPIELQGDE